MSQELLGGVYVFRRDKGGTVLFPAGALLHEKVGDPMRLADGAAFIVKFELKFALIAAGIKRAVVGNKPAARTKGKNKAITSLGWRERVRSQKTKVDELIEVRPELLPHYLRAMFEHGDAAKPFRANIVITFFEYHSVHVLPVVKGSEVIEQPHV